MLANDELPSAAPIRTPPGTIQLIASCHDHPLAVSNSGEAFWESDAGRVFLRVVPYAPKLPKGVDILGAYLALWIVEATQEFRGLELRAELMTGLLKGTPDSGEGLDAMTWSQEGFDLTIGTYDSEYLMYRCRQQMVPACWGETGLDGRLIEYASSGLSLHLPPIPSGQRAVLHHTVAWAQTIQQGEDKAASWFAVDVPFAVVDQEIRRGRRSVRSRPL